MVAIVRTEWSGTSGGPGLTQLAISGGLSPEWGPGAVQGAVDAVRAFWFSMVTRLPNELTLTVSPVVDVYDETNGDLIASYSAGTVPAPVVGGSATNYAAGAGFKITWNTGQIRNGRRVRGTTFVVPAANTVYSTSGMIEPTTQTAVNSAAATLISSLTTNATSLMVWSRPGPTAGATDGVQTQVLSGSCSGKTAILRGRRD